MGTQRLGQAVSRTTDGHEVDSLIDDGQQLVPIDANLTASPKPGHAEGIECFRALFGDRAERGLVVCICRERFQLTSSVDVVPLGN